jgi:hypothetical protein
VQIALFSANLAVEENGHIALFKIPDIKQIKSFGNIMSFSKTKVNKT